MLRICGSIGSSGNRADEAGDGAGEADTSTTGGVANDDVDPGALNVGAGSNGGLNDGALDDGADSNGADGGAAV
jgi:hypothetical protein